MLTGQALSDWLVWAVHNRKPPRRVPTPARKGPPRDEDYKAWIRTLPCVACGIAGRSEAAHTGRDGGMSMKASDYSCVPLCSACHKQTPGAYHRVGKRAFEDRYDLCFVRIVAQLNREWLARCA